MKFLSVAGTVAMFMVGGGILTHGIPGAHEVIHHAAEAAGSVGGVGAGTTSLHVVARAPAVHVDVDFDAAGFSAVARAFLECLSQLRVTKELIDGPARFVKTQGEWIYGANAATNQFPEQVECRLLKRAVLSWQFRVPPRE